MLVRCLRRSDAQDRENGVSAAKTGSPWHARKVSRAAGGEKFHVLVLEQMMMIIY